MYWTQVSGDLFGNPWQSVELTATAAKSDEALRRLAYLALANFRDATPGYALPPRRGKATRVRLRSLGFLANPALVQVDGIDPFLIEIPVTPDKAREDLEPVIYLLVHGVRQAMVATLITGQSDLIHNLVNGAEGIAPTPRAVAEFVDFFCSFVAGAQPNGESVPFSPVLNATELRFDAPAGKRGTDAETSVLALLNDWEVSESAQVLAWRLERLDIPDTVWSASSAKRVKQLLTAEAGEWGLLSVFGPSTYASSPKTAPAGPWRAFCPIHYVGAVFEASFQIDIGGPGRLISIGMDNDMPVSADFPFYTRWVRNYRQRTGPQIFTWRAPIQDSDALHDGDIRTLLERAMVPPHLEAATSTLERQAPVVIRDRRIDKADLEGRTLFLPVVFEGCEFLDDIDLSEARLESSFRLINCSMAGVIKARNARIAGDIEIRHCDVWGVLSDQIRRTAPRIDLQGADIGGSLNLQSTTVRGPVQARSIKVGRELNLVGLEVLPLTPPSLAWAKIKELPADRSQEVGAGLGLHASERPGLDLRGAQVGGDVMLAATVRRDPFAAPSSQTAGDYSNCWVSGEVFMSRMRIGGSLHISGLIASSLQAESCQVAGHIASHLQAQEGSHWQVARNVILNQVDLSHSDIGGYGDFRAWLVGGDFNLQQSRFRAYVAFGPYRQVSNPQSPYWLQRPTRPEEMDGVAVPDQLTALFDPALDAATNYGQTQIGGSLNLSGLQSQSWVSLNGTAITGDVDLTTCQLGSFYAQPAWIYLAASAPEDPRLALLAARLRRLECADAHIAGTMDLSGLVLLPSELADGDPADPAANPRERALHFSNVEVMGNLTLSAADDQDRYLAQAIRDASVVPSPTDDPACLVTPKSSNGAAPWVFLGVGDVQPAQVRYGPSRLHSWIDGNIELENCLIDGALELTGLNDFRGARPGRIDLLDIKVMGDVRALADRFEVSRDPDEPGRIHKGDAIDSHDGRTGLNRARVTAFSAEMLECDADVHLTGLCASTSVTLSAADIRGRLQFHHRKGNPEPSSEATHVQVPAFAKIAGSLDLNGSKARHLVLSGDCMVGPNAHDQIRLERAEFERLDFWDPVQIAINFGGLQVRRLHVRDDSIDVLKDLLTHNTPYSADIYATIARAFSQQGKADEARSLLKAMNRYEFWGPPSRSSRREQPLGQRQIRAPFEGITQTLSRVIKGLIGFIGQGAGWGFGLRRWVFIVVAMMVASVGLAWPSDQVCMTSTHSDYRLWREAVPDKTCISPALLAYRNMDPGQLLVRGAPDAAPTKIRLPIPDWHWTDRVKLGLGYSIPVVQLFDSADWEIADQIDLHAPYAVHGLRVLRPSFWADLIRLLSWIAWPLLFLGLNNRARRE